MLLKTALFVALAAIGGDAPSDAPNIHLDTTKEAFEMVYSEVGAPKESPDTPSEYHFDPTLVRCEVSL